MAEVHRFLSVEAERSWLLHTADMHRLYAKLGFGPAGPRLLERQRPGL